MAAHQGEIEIMAHAAIALCFDDPHRAFGGVVVTNGAGSPRTGAYANYSNEQMQAVRREEQKRAAQIGHYAIQVQLAHSSADVKEHDHAGVAADLAQIFASCQPEVVYLHDLADKHDTNVAVSLRCLKALRALPASQRPKHVFGCELWRSLDWLGDAARIAMDSGRRPELAARLLKVFESQISGGKRYDLAVLGLRAAHATFESSRTVDRIEGISLAMDLTPLLKESAPSCEAYVTSQISRFCEDVNKRLRSFA